MGDAWARAGAIAPARRARAYRVGHGDSLIDLAEHRRLVDEVLIGARRVKERMAVAWVDPARCEGERPTGEGSRPSVPDPGVMNGVGRRAGQKDGGLVEGVGERAISRRSLPAEGHLYEQLVELLQA